VKNWRDAFWVARAEIEKSKKALDFLRKQQMIHLKLILHGIRKTLSKERKTMIKIDGERFKRQLRQVVDAWRFEGKV
jgi:hypothetical protein